MTNMKQKDWSGFAEGGADKNGWRTIESAPKDGTHVLGYGPNEHKGYYITDIHFWSGKWTIMWMSGFGAPTHWQPLPPPPENAE